MNTITNIMVKNTFTSTSTMNTMSITMAVKDQSRPSGMRSIKMAKHKGGKGGAFAGTRPAEDKQPKDSPSGGKWDGTGALPKNIKYPTNVYLTNNGDSHKDGD